MREPKLTHQSLGRQLTAWERDFAAALESAFAAGHHDPAAVAAALTSAGVARADGSGSAWTSEALQAILRSLNDDLNSAYAENGIGA